MPISSLLMSSLSSGGGGNGAAQGFANTASGLVSGITGFFQKRKANKLLANLSQPTYTVPNEVMQNQKMAQLAASEGLPSQQYNNAMKNIQNNQATAIAGAQDRRSALMALPKIQQQTNAATANLDTQDAMARRQNQQMLYNINALVGQYRDKAFKINQLDPYNRNYNYAMGLLGAGNQNLLGGIDKLAGGAGQIANSALGGGKTRNYSSGGGSGTPDYYNNYGANNDYSTFENGFGG